MIIGIKLLLKAALYVVLGVIAVLVVIGLLSDDRPQPKKVSYSPHQSVSLAIIADTRLSEQAKSNMLLRANCAKFVAVHMHDAPASHRFADSVFNEKQRVACRNMWRGDDSRKCKLFDSHAYYAKQYRVNDDTMNKVLPAARKLFNC